MFWKDVSKANGEKVYSCSRIKVRNGKLALEEIEVQRIRRSILRRFII